MELPVRRGLVDFLVQKAVEAAATAAVGRDCCGVSAGAAVLLEHEDLLARAGEVLHGGVKATKEDVRTALAKAGRADLCKRLEVQNRGRRAVAHLDPGLSKQVLAAIRPVLAKQKEPPEAVVVDGATAKPDEFGKVTQEHEQGHAEQVPATTASQAAAGQLVDESQKSVACGWADVEDDDELGELQQHADEREHSLGKPGLVEAKSTGTVTSRPLRASRGIQTMPGEQPGQGCKLEMVREGVASGMSGDVVPKLRKRKGKAKAGGMRTAGPGLDSRNQRAALCGTAGGKTSEVEHVSVLLAHVAAASKPETDPERKRELQEAVWHLAQWEASTQSRAAQAAQHV